ncbi:MAG: hypothetical protein R3F62_29970 [Planctomycetota bacterium]
MLAALEELEFDGLCAVELAALHTAHSLVGDLARAAGRRAERLAASGGGWACADRAAS